MDEVESSVATPLSIVAQWTRWLQIKYQDKPIRGLRRLANWLSDILPHYEGPVNLPKEVTMWLDSMVDQERYLLFMGDYQPPLTNFLHRYTPKGAYCLDVGANIGYYTLLFSRWAGETGRVVAFEANPHLVPRIQRNIELNHYTNVEVICKAVHDVLTQVAFYISAHPGTSSIYAQNVADTLETIHVETITVDSFMAERSWERLDIIKMDIEGNDCFAIHGALETIKRFRPVIVFEYWPSSADTIERTKALFDSLDYRLEGLFWNGDKCPFDWQVPAGSKHIDVLCYPQ